MTTKLQTVLRKTPLGYFLAFIAGASITHFLGFARNATVPAWATVALYVLSALVLLYALWTLRNINRFWKEQGK